MKFCYDNVMNMKYNNIATARIILKFGCWQKEIRNIAFFFCTAASRTTLYTKMCL